MTPAEAEATVAARGFETMGLEALRAEWRRRYGAPPTLRSVQLLRHMLAWRVQADAMGGRSSAVGEPGWRRLVMARQRPQIRIARS